MKKKFGKVGNFLKRFNVLPKVLCILVAFLLWLYVTAVESPDHEEVVSFVPVELVGAGTILSEHNLTVESGKDIKVDLVVKGQQSTISRYGIEDYNVTADISWIKTSGRYEIELHYDLPSGITLSSSSRNSIDVYVDEEIEKTVEVRHSVICTSEYSIGEYKLEPDVITVSGPKKYVDDVAYAEVAVNAGRITSTTTVSGPLTLKSASNVPITSPYLGLSQDIVKVTIPVNVSKVVDVKVQYKYDFYKENMASVKVEPSTVTIVGEASVLDTIDFISTDIVNEKDISDDMTLTKSLIIPSGIKLGITEKDTVQLKISHIGTQKKQFSISTKNINVIGGDNLKYDILNDFINVTVRGKNEILKDLTAEDFVVTLDLTGYSNDPLTVDVPYTVNFEAESYKAYVVGANNENIKVKIG